MPYRRDFHKVIIGRSEMLTFVDSLSEAIPAKVDTGAYRSAVHAQNIIRNNTTGILSFDLLAGHPMCGSMNAHIETQQFSIVTIENSFGQRQKRYEVKLKVKLGPKVFMTKFTLADRAKKTYPILLGRQMLNNRFLVDTAESSVNRAELKTRCGVDFPNDEEEGRDENRDSI